MTTIEYMLQFVPEIGISILGVAAFLVCLYSFLRYKDMAAFGYLYVTLFTASVYASFFIFQPIEETRRLFARIAIIGLLIEIIIWRIDFMRREGCKHGR